MKDFAGKIFRGDSVIWVVFLFLCLISIIEVYSASSMLTFKTNYWQPIMKHTMFLLMGAVIVLIVHSLEPKSFRFFVLSLPLIWVLLVATQFIGSSVNGANRYILGFQPSEIAKLSLITCIAFILSQPKKKISNNAKFLWIWILTGITCLLIFRDNFSTAAILYGIVGIMMFIGRVPYKKLGIFILVTLIIIASVFAFIWFFPAKAKKAGLRRGVLWVERFTDFKGQQDVRKGSYVINDDNYQTTQANIAVARGRIIGTMPGNSQQRDFLPQAYSDFIYAIIIEETGIVGGIAVLFLYVFLFIRAGTIAGQCKKLFPKYLVMGSALMIVMQAMVNMAVSVGLLPVTGQPLPLISKGGSSVLVTCVYVGIILSVSRFENQKGIRKEAKIVGEYEREKQLALEDEDFDLQSAY